MSTTSFTNLPEETTVEILLKLRVKDIIRSSSVSKTWYSLINNPSFISTQIHNAVSKCDENAMLVIPPVTSQLNYCPLISVDTSQLIEKFDIPFETKTQTLKLLTDINGLLLLTDLHTDYTSKELYLWNPYVRRHRLLASSCFRKLIDDHKRTLRVVGMGYDIAADDYKIVRIVYVGDHKGKLFGEVAPKVEIFSLRENTWGKLKNVGVPRLVYDMGTYFDGCYYWLQYNQYGTDIAHGCYGNGLSIMSFDFHNELFGELKVPDNVPYNLGRCPHKLMQFKDSLALCVLRPPLHDKGDTTFPYCIWLMRQENDVVTWTLRFTALFKEIGYPLGITKNGTLIVESICSDNHDVTRIVSCNLKSMIHKIHGFGLARRPISQTVLDVSSVDPSFPESLILYEGGKLLLRSAK